MRSVVLAIPFGLFGSFTYAQTATPEGAEALKAVVQTYLGAVEGVVSVVPEGGAYGLTIDFAPLLAKSPDDVTAKITPLQYSLTEMGDGTWTMTQNQAFDLTMSAPKAAEISFSFGNISGTGVFDEALGAFRSSSTTLTDMKLVETIFVDPSVGDTYVEYNVASVRYESTGKAGANGGVDMVGTYSMEGLAETFTVPGLAAPLTLSAASGTGTMQIDAMRPDALYKLLAFVVANPSEAAITAQQDQFKALLTEGMPIFDHLVATSGMSSLAVQSQVGVFSADDATVTVEANGLVDDGLFREAISLTGVKVPQGLAPEWAVDLVPNSLLFDIKVAGFNPAKGLRALLDGIDLSDPQKQPDELAMMQAWMPNGEVAVTLQPSSLTASIAGITAEGSLNFGASDVPNGKGTVTMTGMTAARQALTKAPPEVGMQAAPVLGMAEGIAKPGENGALVWELELTADGRVLVNGVDMQAMGGP